MNITKIYYEELRSEQINGKWTSKKIGAEVKVNIDESLQDCLGYAKEYVRINLDDEEYQVKPTKQKLVNVCEQIKEALEHL